MIKLVVGLGNPGRQYENTRHNAGFLFLDHLAAVKGFGWSLNGQFQGEVANLSLSNDKLVLLKPITFMNRSGLSVGGLLRYYKIKPEEMLVVHDELDLPEGVVRMKRDGGHAGHNGLRDIIAHVGSRDFYRLRIGIGRRSGCRCFLVLGDTQDFKCAGAIGRPVSGSVADYVLSRPSSHAFELLDSVFRLLESNLNLVLAGDVSAANGRFAR